MKISDVKREKISEQILAFLFSKSPQAVFTSHIAREIARDEEYVKNILVYLKSKKLVISIDRNPKGEVYRKRLRWKLSDIAYNIYRNKQ